MQASHYVPDEIEGRHGLRASCSLPADHAFAEEVLGEKKKLVPKAMEKGQTIWHDINSYTKDRQWIIAIWGIESLWLIFVTLMIAMEMWGSCPFEMGFTPVCKYCYSTTFLVWNGGLLALWFMNLYLYVLLISRGFSFKLRSLGHTVGVNKAKGIPVNAIYMFIYLTIALFAWLAVGIVVIVMSNQCLRDGRIFGHSGRSILMFTTTFIGLVACPVLMFLGRVNDIDELAFQTAGIVDPFKIDEDDY